MVREPNVRPSFFKVLIKDYKNRLSLPHVFVQRCEKFLPKSAKMRTRSGQTWKVKLEKTDHDAKCCFTQGWNKFAKDLNLELGEFLVFWFDIGNSTFDVSVYGVDACERQISAKDSDADEDFEFKKDCSNFPGDQAGVARNFPVKVKIEDNQELASNTVMTWKFSKELKKYHSMDRLSIPKRFAVGTGVAKKRNVILQDAKGRKWPVNVTDRNAGIYSLSAGWRDFLIGNNVLIGSIISFEVIPSSDNVIEALVIKNGTGKEHSIPAKRGKRRPLSRRI